MNIVIPWYETDSVPIEFVKQIPEVAGVASSLNYIPVGEVWPHESIDRLKTLFQQQNLKFEVIDSLPVHGIILERKGEYLKYLDNLKASIENLGKVGIRCICYTFDFDYSERFPFKNAPDHLFNNLAWFLDQIIPIASEYNIDLALHPEILLSEKEMDHFLELNESPHNGLTLCCQTIASDAKRNFQGYVRKYLGMGRVPYAHLNNIKFDKEGHLIKCAHSSSCGSLDMMQVVKAFHDSRYKGYFSPDWGRVIWHKINSGESAFFDRALSIMYLAGIWETLDKIDWED